MVPYWGDPELLRATVRSVLAQSDDRWRLTVLDDAYPDPWAGEYLASLGDPRVRYVRNESNQGVAASFARCVELSGLEAVVICGCDDLLGPHYVATVLEALDAHPGADLVQPGVAVVGADGQPARTLADTVKQRLIRPRGEGTRELEGERLVTSLLHGDWLYWPSLAFRRDVLVRTPFRTEFSVALDLALVVDLVCAGSRLVVVPTTCFTYRRHAASVSSVELLDGARFAGEREYFALARTIVSALGWRRAARAARLHVTSRLHALTLLPAAVRRAPRAVPALLRHAVGS
jgi:hypothetical protein